MLGLLILLERQELQTIQQHGTQQTMQPFEITGVQLEVGSVATDFEHRSFAQELALCQRYCQILGASHGDLRLYANRARTMIIP